jgi:uncharacterized protein YdhG (YjbR/CyaY superfamily)
MKNTAIAKSVNEYLATLPEEQQAALERLRQIIRTAAPQAKEAISFHIPCYKYKGQLVLFAGYAGHCSFFVVNKNIVTAFEEELITFKTAGATIHFTPENPLPAELVEKIVKKRVQENEGMLGEGAG